LVGAVLLGLFFVRPGVQHLRNRITAEISMAVGRQVEVSAVNFHLLPRPGFELENFVVTDNPAFGVEPMLRSPEVTAALRLTSLLRGRLEISRLSLSEPSLNLVRNNDGVWNIEDLLQRNAQIPAAPTSKPRSERRPGFPYIEASQGRINCKLGQEKTPYSLTDADFSLWQDSENSWGMRLQAVPLRTDQNVSDTGVLTINGLWQRAASLRETPLQFRAQWGRAQFGQFTKLIHGHDSGWRGTVQLNVNLSGIPRNLKVASTVSVRDFRRFDILSGGELRLAANCKATYSSSDHSLSDIDCEAPVGTGEISVTGNVANLLGPRQCDLALTAQGLPLESVVALAVHAKHNIPGDLQAEGTTDAHFAVRCEGVPYRTIWQGGGTTNQFRLISKSGDTDLALGSVPFVFANDANKATKNALAQNEVTNMESRLEIGPFRMPLGKPTAMNVQGWVSLTGYGFLLHGEAQPQQLAAAAHTVGIEPPQPTPIGAKTKNLQIAGNWSEIIRHGGVKD
jgi:AsmA protein